MNLDKCAEYIIGLLNENGYKAYAVGGCIRDMLLGIEPSSIDICTDAFPSTLISIFNDNKLNAFETDIRYGTVSILASEKDIDKSSTDSKVRIYKVSTFIKSNTGDNVEFSSSLEDDLSRRDFTINALAFNSKDGLIDLYDGADDIKNKTIKCIGNAKQRIGKDKALIIRAIRYQAQLGFKIDSETHKQINSISLDAYAIPQDQIKSEFEKLIVCKYAQDALIDNKRAISKIIPEFKKTLEFDIGQNYNNDNLYDHLVNCVSVLINKGEEDLNLRIATLMHDIAKPVIFKNNDYNINESDSRNSLYSSIMASEILRRLNFNDNVIDEVSAIIENFDIMITGKSSLKILLNRMKYETIVKILELKYANAMTKNIEYGKLGIVEYSNAVKWLKEIVDNKDFITVSDLAISGKDLIQIGIRPGKIYSTILNDVLYNVINGTLKNNRDTLIGYVDKKYKIN
ncbi:MAG: HD domain-containing protein [Lachnospiraceae bacterium]|nr:HD domain-containing protein [Lachnospiraceae bacterium]